VPDVQVPEASAEQALQYMQDMRVEDGPSLYMGQQLPRKGQLQVVSSPLAIHRHTDRLWRIPGLLQPFAVGPQTLPEVRRMVQIQPQARRKHEELVWIL